MQRYLEPGVVLRLGLVSPAVQDLQRDLRRLGYLRTGIDGRFGPVTTAAVKALQHDLLHNRGRGRDGDAPVAICDYNRGRVHHVTGVADPRLGECIANMLNDPLYPKLPFALDPVAENRRACAAVEALALRSVPLPFLLGVLAQESGLRHFAVPTPGNADNFVVVGLDSAGRDPWTITSRGYGIGQYTLFHHPPRADEVRDLILDPVRNVEHAIAALFEKWTHFVISDDPRVRADDRLAEHGSAPLRICKYDPADAARYLRDCRRCLQEAGYEDLGPTAPLHPGAAERYAPARFYPETTYRDVPIRRNVPCDWPYAIRRYNGAGSDSYHYQARVLLHVRGPEEGPARTG